MRKSLLLLPPLLLCSCSSSLNSGSALSTPSSTIEAILYPEMNQSEDFFTKTGSNDAYWWADQMTPEEASPLKGKTIYWLGSSVTYGAQSAAESMADYLQARTGCHSVKEAVSGTTLRQQTGKTSSYVERMKTSKKFDSSATIDAFVCQLSTNDASFTDPAVYGSVTSSEIQTAASFDLATTYGAIEYIIAYVRSTWHCPIFFYTGSFYSSGNGERYAEMVKTLQLIATKWNIRLIDLFSDAEFNALGAPHYAYWMHDAIHPYKAGYRAWWTPYFEAKMSAVFAQ